LNPSIFDAVDFATRKNFLTRMMITNGYLLESDKVKKLNDAGLTHMQISIDGVNPNETTVKVLKPLRPKLENLAKLRNFSVTINSVIGAAPSEEVEEVFNFAENMGFTPRVLVVHNEKGQIKLKPEEIALYQQLRERIYKSRVKKTYLDKLLAGEEAPFKCRGGSRYLYVDEFGIVHYCSQTMKEYGKPLDEFSLHDLKKNFYARHACTRFCTISCARNNSSLDEWRQQ
jgi:MoaA/NifB/PqqE/SkfB family radical SAM enzyme